MNRTSWHEQLNEARNALRTNPEFSEAIAEERLKIAPDDVGALLILGAAHRRKGNLIESLAVLKPLARARPAYADAHYEWGVTQAALGLDLQAVASLRQATSLEPAHADAWRELGILLMRSGQPGGAEAAFMGHVRAALRHPILAAASRAADDGELATAETALRAYLDDHPADPAALRMLGDLRLHLDDNVEAAALFARAVALAPGFTPARRGLALALLQQGRSSARPHVERLLLDAPADPIVRNLHAVLLAMTGDYAGAIGVYRALLAEGLGDARMWLRLGHALRTSGRPVEAVHAYREAAAAAPSLGDAYWSLANLKTVVFTLGEVQVMLAQLADASLGQEDRFYLEYALGRAFEQSGDFDASFAHYAEGSRIRRLTVRYDAAYTTARFNTLQRVMDAAFFASRGDGGYGVPAPIFIVGLPRSGSTLVEQILASHSMVEGTSELHDMGNIARDLGWGQDADGAIFVEAVLALTPADRAALGARYIEQTAVHRRLGSGRFIDKMPGNFVHVGLIRLILPNARIIDTRRASMSAGLAVFKQLFAHGQEFSYDLREIGRFYRDYRNLMSHWDVALPGHVHRVQYETLVNDTQTQIRQVLAYCGLEFEHGCVRFHETKRDVLTASSEQVRQPIFQDGLDHWRNYEPWLSPLLEALNEPMS